MKEKHRNKASEHVWNGRRVLFWKEKRRKIGSRRENGGIGRKEK